MGWRMMEGWDTITKGVVDKEQTNLVDTPKVVVDDTKDVVTPTIVVKDTPRKRITPDVNRDESPDKDLYYGGAGSGKTRAAIHKFRKKWEKNKDIICWYIDTERGLKKTLKEFPREIDSNIEVFECNTFKNVIKALKLTLENAQKGDTIIVDMLSIIWDWAQENYTLEVFDNDVTSFYLARRKDRIAKSSKKPVYEGWQDWIGIKLLHNHDFIDELVKQTGADLICICGAKEVDMNEPGKPPKVLNPTIFTPIGFAPEGEKHNEHRFDTIVYFQCGEDNWYIKAPKWRGNYDMLRKKITIPPKEFAKI